MRTGMGTATDTVAIVIADGSWGSALRSAEQLGRRGIRCVIGAVGGGSNIYRRSRWCEASIDLKERPTSPLDWLTTLGALIDPSSPAVLIPTSDRTLELLSAVALPEQWILSAPPADVAADFLDKRQSLPTASAAGILVPPWVEVSELAHLERLKGLPGPIALRPTAWNTAGTKPIKVVRCTTVVDAEQIAHEQLMAGAQLIAQQYLDAPEDAVEFAIIWSDGERASVCTGRKRRQSHPEGGVMVWGQTAQLPDVRKAALRFLEHSGFVGLGGLEFIRVDGDLHFIEFNPRLEAIHFLAAAAGHPTVVYEFERLAGLSTNQRIPDQLDAAAWVGGAAVQRVQADRSVATIACDRLHFARAPRKVKAVWTFRDPAPGVALTLHNGSRALRSMTRRARG